MEIYNEAVKDLLSTDSTPLRLLDDPEVVLFLKDVCFIYILQFVVLIWMETLYSQKGTVVEKLTEEILRDWNHLKELISVCEGETQNFEQKGSIWLI